MGKVTMAKCTNNADVFVEKKDGKVVVTIDSCYAVFNNQELDWFIGILKKTKVYGENP